MERRWLLGLLPAAAAAQVTQDEIRVWLSKFPQTTVPPSAGGYPKPANGECPVCHTMAPPFKPIEIGVNAVTWEPMHLTHDRVECAHCRCVFGMDAEADDER